MYPNPKLLTKRAIHEVAPLGLSQVTLVGEQEVHSIFPTLGARWSVVIRAEQRVQCLDRYLLLSKRERKGYYKTWTCGRQTDFSVIDENKLLATFSPFSCNIFYIYHSRSSLFLLFCIATKIQYF